jgi:hypothetical protein
MRETNTYSLPVDGSCTIQMFREVITLFTVQKWFTKNNFKIEEEKKEKKKEEEEEEIYQREVLSK